LSGNHLLIPYRELTSNIGMLVYNTLSATRKILRRRFSFVEKVTPVFYIPRRGLTILCNTGKIKFFPRTVVIEEFENEKMDQGGILPLSFQKAPQLHSVTKTKRGELRVAKQKPTSGSFVKASWVGGTKSEI